MSFLLKPSDYARENHKYRPPPKTDKSLKKTTSKDLAHCPRRCTQRRTINNHLSERKTYDPRTNMCRNCGFKYTPNQTALKPVKASQIKSSGNPL